jgi:hypothetical protein
MKADLLQLRDHRYDSGSKHHAIDEMVGDLGSYRLMRFVIRVLA